MTGVIGVEEDAYHVYETCGLILFSIRIICVIRLELFYFYSLFDHCCCFA